MLRTLLRLRLRLWWASERTDGGIFLFASVAGLLVLAGALWSTRLLFTLLDERTAVDPAVVVLVGFGGVGIFRVLAAVRQSVERLYLAPDLELLLTAPVTNRHVFAAKVIEVAVASPLSLLTLAVLCLGYAQANGAPVALLLAVPATLALGVATTLPGIALVILLVRLVPPARLQLALTLLPAVFVVPLAVFSPAFAATTAGDGSLPFAGMTREGLLWLPTSWPAQLVIGPVEARWTAVVVASALTAGSIAVLGRVTSGLFHGSFLATWGQIQESPPRIHRGGFLERLVPPLSRPARAIVLKDWRTLTRDLKAAAGLFFIIMALGYLLLTSTRRGGGTVLIFAPMIIGSFLMQAFEQEGRSFAMIRATPVDVRRVFHAKLVAYLLPMGAGMWVALVVAGVLGSFTGGQLVVVCLSASVLLVGVGAISLSFAAIGTRHRIDPPKAAPHIGMLSGIVSMVFFLPNYTLTAWVLATADGDRSGFGQPVVGLLALALSAAAWVGVAALVRRAVARLDALEFA